jgi:DNA-directed RNA polymerase sigma subunit (sigma70/sigma32)
MKHNFTCYDLSRSELEYLIDEYIFNERDRSILKRRLLDGICFEPLAEEFELSEKQVRNILYKYTKILDRKLTDNS